METERHAMISSRNGFLESMHLRLNEIDGWLGFGRVL